MNNDPDQIDIMSENELRLECRLLVAENISLQAQVKFEKGHKRRWIRVADNRGNMYLKLEKALKQISDAIFDESNHAADNLQKIANAALKNED